MEIGKQGPAKTIEPVKSPVPPREPAPTPAPREPAKTPAKPEREKVGA
jgi:hypothetical protein